MAWLTTWLLSRVPVLTIEKAWLATRAGRSVLWTGRRSSDDQTSDPGDRDRLCRARARHSDHGASWSHGVRLQRGLLVQASWPEPVSLGLPSLAQRTVEPGGEDTVREGDRPARRSEDRGVNKTARRRKFLDARFG